MFLKPRPDQRLNAREVFGIGIKTTLGPRVRRWPRTTPSSNTSACALSKPSMFVELIDADLPTGIYFSGPMRVWYHRAVAHCRGFRQGNPQAEEPHPALHTVPNNPTRVPPPGVHLGLLARVELQRHEHFLPRRLQLRDIPADGAGAAGKAVLVTQPLIDPLGRVTLLGRGGRVLSCSHHASTIPATLSITGDATG